MEKGKKRKSSPPRWREIAVNLPGGSALMRRVREQKIVDSWKEAVGAGVAEQTQPKRVRNQILEVQVSNSVWIQQLQFMKKLIIKKLHEKAGFDFLQDIRFFIGEVGHMDKKESLQESPSPLSKSEQEKIMKEVSGVQDPEMQNILSGLYSRALTLKRNRMEKRKNKP
jgi:hypothetical protein